MAPALHGQVGLVNRVRTIALLLIVTLATYGIACGWQAYLAAKQEPPKATYGLLLSYLENSQLFLRNGKATSLSDHVAATMSLAGALEALQILDKGLNQACIRRTSVSPLEIPLRRIYLAQAEVSLDLLNGKDVDPDRLTRSRTEIARLMGVLPSRGDPDCIRVLRLLLRASAEL